MIITKVARKVMELADMNNSLYPKALYDNYISIIREYNV